MMKYWIALVILIFVSLVTGAQNPLVLKGNITDKNTDRYLEKVQIKVTDQNYTCDKAHLEQSIRLLQELEKKEKAQKGTQ